LRDTSISRATRSQSIDDLLFFVTAPFVAAARFGAVVCFGAAPFFAAARFGAPLSFAVVRFGAVPLVAVVAGFRAGVRDSSLFLAVVLFAMIRGYNWDKQYVD
jgi:hypothetical protein